MQAVEGEGWWTDKYTKPELTLLSLAGNISELLPRFLCAVHPAVAGSEEGVPQLSHSRHLTDALHCPGQLH